MNKPNLPKAVGAGIAGTIVMTIMTMVAPMMGMPEMNIPAMLADFMGFPVVVGWLAHFMIGTVLALIYVYAFIGKLPGTPWLKGALYGLAPWLLAQVMVNPMMGAGVFAVNTPAPMMMVIGSLIGHIVYGSVVGLVYGTEQVESPTAAHSH
jgi:uncharacterized membrane protein YagU involved in acid resistance